MMEKQEKDRAPSARQMGTSRGVASQGRESSPQKKVAELEESLRHFARATRAIAKSTRTMSDGGESQERDDLYRQAVRMVLETGRGSVSLLQRHFELGYTRAARMIDLMAEDGIVGEYKGAAAREVLITIEDWERGQGEAAKVPNWAITAITDKDEKKTLPSWHRETITREEILRHAGWKVSQGVVMIDENNNEVTLTPGQIIHIRPGISISFRPAHET